MKKLIVGLAVSLSLFAGSASAYMKCGSLGVIQVSEGAKSVTALGKDWNYAQVIKVDGLSADDVAVVYDNKQDGSSLRLVVSNDKLFAAYYNSAADNLNGNYVLVGKCR